MSHNVVVVATGTANTASVLAAFRRLGERLTLARGPEDLSSAGGVVLPGVGAFGAAMVELERTEMNDMLRERVFAGLPTLAICVGMQLLAEKSEESPQVTGLGVLGAEVTRFGPGVRMPQLGWNRVKASDDCRLVEDGWAYFANSYRIGSIPEGWAGAISTYDGEFVSALEKGEVLACQFHPELSGAWGSALLTRWLERVR